ncbi:FKBP-type peptidyl-prolyl cis-trans isomerase [Lonepinella koalarum]|uniref:Peptidyl-prolyl cis-trans isomerase n=1 Tax=Lonepinella koalarum TaxID=53417 RepID=A0A4R1KZN0_9PAST|nr:FKBP-type peptidyl-prolyl cis-trans isomerase [Lonepinella koalarum]MDH2925903.1 peptidylprolyl isomerase [Lonepinella koalarum]TCK71055.1 FKBP-type peptidyl-prolyl cis-trans isomerase FkpA [Lonepinella koalarum]TFJ90787.1 FKBP-type peptidyl-prolyl cis-trans isomerase [Lonepinella koalarum]TYG34570.1 FKBP-type peptidyl-prolyl cis-trans isomerase [Lonepinella koalarum]
MLKIKKISMLALLISAAIVTTACNEKQTAASTDAAKPAQTQAESGDVKDNSYAVGVLFGTDLKGVMDAQKEFITYDQDKLLSGLKDTLDGKVDLNNPELVNTLKALDETLKAESQKKAAEQAKKAQEDGAKFIADFKKKEGVQETQSGLLYHIEQAGDGEPIKPEDTIKVHYTGKLTNGTVFDSSLERGEPAEFVLNQLIPGWVEGLQLIKKGGKIELVVPPALAYGEQDMGQIPANSTLYFELEVLDVTPANSAK